MRKIRVKFSGLAGGMTPENNFIMNILKQRYTVELSEDPQFLVYSQNSSDFLDYPCPRIFYTAENLVPDFNLCDYGISFQNLNFGDRYIRYPVYLVDSFCGYKGDSYGADLELAQHKHEISGNLLEQKTAFCSFVYSNADAAVCRQRLYEALSEYKQVSSGGRYLNNIGGPVENKREFQTKHKFVIAFENTSSPGYTTEKIVHAFAAGAVPIYWGNPEITKEFNAGSFINCHDFGLTKDGEKEAIHAIIEEVKRIDADDEAYLKMLRTPAFADSNNVEAKQQEFVDFLYSIFDQETEQAYRRNRFYWGERYERKQRIGNTFYQQCRKLIPVRDILRKIVGKWK